MLVSSALSGIISFVGSEVLILLSGLGRSSEEAVPLHKSVYLVPFQQVIFQFASLVYFHPSVLHGVLLGQSCFLSGFASFNACLSGLLSQLITIRHILLVTVVMIVMLQLFHLLMLPLRSRLPVPTLRSLELLLLLLR